MVTAREACRDKATFLGQGKTKLADKDHEDRKVTITGDEAIPVTMIIGR